MHKHINLDTLHAHTVHAYIHRYNNIMHAHVHIDWLWENLPLTHKDKY